MPINPASELGRLSERWVLVLDDLEYVTLLFLATGRGHQRSDRGGMGAPSSDDFAEVPLPGWKRLTPGGEVRLRYSYVMRCDEVVKDASGQVVELKCSIDQNTLGKKPEGRKVKGVIHFLSCVHALPAEIRLYDRLFNVAQPDADKAVGFCTHLNPSSLTIVQGWVEAAVKDVIPETRYQFERLGYFVADRRDHQAGEKLVFNRTVTLRDSWAKE
jgi:glutaminyl-tRNA synthetase